MVFAAIPPSGKKSLSWIRAWWNTGGAGGVKSWQAQPSCGQTKNE